MSTFQLIALGALVLVAAAILIEFAVEGLRENLGMRHRSAGGPGCHNRAAWWARRRT